MKWLQWIIDNAWTVIIIGGVLAQMLQAALKKRSGEDGTPPAERPPEFEFEDPELAERTRRIREEIQRKIAQRQQGRGGEPQPVPPRAESTGAPPPVIREVVVTPAPAPAPARAASRLDAERQAEILERQAALADRLREIQQLKDAAAKRTEFELATADRTAERRTAARAGVLGDLQNPDALRRAFVLREVLGPPLALRK